MPENYNQSKREENLGRAIYTISFIKYALKFIIIVSIIALVVLYFLNLPLWIAPITGLLVFLLWQFILRLILKAVFYSQK